MTHLGPRFYGSRNRRRRPMSLVAVALAAAVGAGHTARAEPAPGVAAALPAHPALTRAAFAGLLMRLQRKSFADEQLGFVRDSISRGDYFTCAQAGQLMRVAGLGDDQVKIATALYPHLVDPENFAQLIALLALDSDRQELRSLVSRGDESSRNVTGLPNIY